MTREALPALPPAFAATRDALHRLAVYVISPAQRLSNGEIILRATPGGFSTFGFGGRTVGVAGAELVVDGVRHPIGSLNDTARLVGIAPDVAQQEHVRGVARRSPRPGPVPVRVAVGGADRRVLRRAGL
jgi:hypothetical protein